MNHRFVGETTTPCLHASVCPRAAARPRRIGHVRTLLARDIPSATSVFAALATSARTAQKRCAPTVARAGAAVKAGWAAVTTDRAARAAQKRARCGSPADNTSTGDVFKLSIPLFIELFMQIMVGNVNQVMLSPFGTDPAAAVGNALQILNIITIALSAMGTASTVLITRVVGKKNAQRSVSEIATMALVVNVTLAGVMTAVLFAFWPQLFALLNVDSAIRGLAGAFTRCRRHHGGAGRVLRAYGAFARLCARGKRDGGKSADERRQHRGFGAAHADVGDHAGNGGGVGGLGERRGARHGIGVGGLAASSSHRRASASAPPLALPLGHAQEDARRGHPVFGRADELRHRADRHPVVHQRAWHHGGHGESVLFSHCRIGLSLLDRAVSGHADRAWLSVRCREAGRHRAPRMGH